MKTGNQQAPAENNYFLKQSVIGISDGIILGLACTTALFIIFNNTEQVLFYASWIGLLGGCIIGIAGYFSATSRMESLIARSEEEAERKKREEADKTIELFKQLDLGSDMQAQVFDEINRDNEEWKKFLHAQQQDFEVPDKKQLPITGFIIGISFIAGFVLPVIPYLLYPAAESALKMSVWINLPLLLLIGILKSRINREPVFWGALRVLLIGSAVLAAAWFIAKIFAG